MEPTIVRLSPESTQTRLLMTRGARDLGKVILPGAAHAHPRAASTLLEGLSLFLGERLCVVLCVDERSTSCELDLLDGLGYGARSLFYDGEIYELYLSPEFQGLGFGRRLFTAAPRCWCIPRRRKGLAFRWWKPWPADVRWRPATSPFCAKLAEQ